MTTIALTERLRDRRGRHTRHVFRATEPYVVVVGLDCITGLQSARLLRARGVPVIGVVADPHHFASRTTACDVLVEANHATEDVIDALVALGQHLPHRAVLLPCTDLSVRTLGQHREKLAARYALSLPDQDILELLMDKLLFADYAARENLPIPRTVVVRDEAQAAHAATLLRFPCVAKPAVKTRAFESLAGGKVVRLASSDQWREFYAKHAAAFPELIVQEWIPGGDDQLFSCNAYFDSKGQPLATFIARKLRQWPPERGTSSLGQEVRNDVVLESALKLFGGLRYRGLAYLEMKHDARTGEPVIIEPNIGRPTGRSAIAEAGGVELLYTMYCDALGRPLPDARTQAYSGVKWIYLRHDAQSAFQYWRRGELTLKEWARSWRGRKTFAVWSLRDPGPFIADLRRSVNKLRHQRS